MSDLPAVSEMKPIPDNRSRGVTLMEAYRLVKLSRSRGLAADHAQHTPPGRTRDSRPVGKDPED